MPQLAGWKKTILTQIQIQLQIRLSSCRLKVRWTVLKFFYFSLTSTCTHFCPLLANNNNKHNENSNNENNISEIFRALKQKQKPKIETVTKTTRQDNNSNNLGPKLFLSLSLFLSPLAGFQIQSSRCKQINVVGSLQFAAKHSEANHLEMCINWHFPSDSLAQGHCRLSAVV